MSKALKGYTIIEVLIVLAISTSLLFAAIAIFKGQQSETEFSQAVQDLNSKIVNYADQITAGTFPDSQSYNCSAGGSPLAPTNPPTLSAGSNGVGSRQDCVFLGRAIQVDTIGRGNINVYTIVGNRNASSGETAASVKDTNPTAATITVAGNPQFVMNETYTLGGGAVISSVKAKTTSGITNNNWAMTGIYTDLNGSVSSATGSLQLQMIGYPLPSGGTSSVKSCIQGGSGCVSADTLSEWDLCVQNSDASHAMLLAVTSNSSGISTKLTDEGSNCP